MTTSRNAEHCYHKICEYVLVCCAHRVAELECQRRQGERLTASMVNVFQVRTCYSSKHTDRHANVCTVIMTTALGETLTEQKQKNACKLYEVYFE